MAGETKIVTNHIQVLRIFGQFAGVNVKPCPVHYFSTVGYLKHWIWSGFFFSLDAGGDNDGADKVADKLEELSVKDNKVDGKTSDEKKEEEVKVEEKKWKLGSVDPLIFNLSF